MPPIHVIDFEGSLQTGIVEYGVATIEEGRVAGLHTRLCRPVRRVTEIEARVHGLQDADLAGHAPFSDDWNLFSGLRHAGVLAAHGAGAERSLLGSVWPYPGAVPDWLAGAGEVSDWGPWIDTDRLARVWCPQRPGGTSLEEVVALAGVGGEIAHDAARWCPERRRGWHCAGYDALAAAHVLAFWIRRRGPRLRELLLLSTPSRDRDRASQCELPGLG